MPVCDEVAPGRDLVRGIDRDDFFGERMRSAEAIAAFQSFFCVRGSDGFLIAPSRKVRQAFMPIL
jgi:hypothetical protein